eukprot:8852454-Alexandrium_andersonii.AAC.1
MPCPAAGRPLTPAPCAGSARFAASISSRGARPAGWLRGGFSTAPPRQASGDSAAPLAWQTPTSRPTSWSSSS